jgi:hypothetical protein
MFIFVKFRVTSLRVLFVEPWRGRTITMRHFERAIGMLFYILVFHRKVRGKKCFPYFLDCTGLLYNISMNF